MLHVTHLRNSKIIHTLLASLSYLSCVGRPCGIDVKDCSCRGFFGSLVSHPVASEAVIENHLQDFPHIQMCVSLYTYVSILLLMCICKDIYIFDCLCYVNICLYECQDM